MTHGEKLAYNKGSADYYYCRKPEPHYWDREYKKDGSFFWVMISKDDMTKEEIKQYYKGYEEETEEKDFT